jgi:DNA-binding IclR family transcriptional regulator
MPEDSASKGNGRASGIQVISRVAEILRALNGEHLGLSPSELAGRVNLARSTVHRIVSALESEGLLAAVKPGRYRLGPELIRLAASERGELRLIVRPFLERLSAEVNETVDLAVLIQDHVSFIDQVAAPHRLRAVSTVGATFPAHCTANGKALLAELSDDHLNALIPARLPQLTPNTKGTRAELMAELREIRRAGVAFDDQEHTLGISAVGATISDQFGAVAAVTIPLPSQRYEGNEDALVGALRSACDRINETLGGARIESTHAPAG